MDELSDISIQTNMNENPSSLQTVVSDSELNLTSLVSDIPQVQSIIQDNYPVVSSQVNAPFVEVTSVNGKTGDVITEALIGEFNSNTYYPRNTLISYNGNLYWAKNNFTSSTLFNIDNWNLLESSGVSEWADIKNKPSFSDVAFSGSYDDLLDKPAQVKVNNGILSVKQNSVSVGSFGANSDADIDINIVTPTKTSDLTNDSGFVEEEELAAVAKSGEYNDLINRPSIPSKLSELENDKYFVYTDSPVVRTNIIPDVTHSRLADNSVHTNNIDWSNFMEVHTSALTTNTGTGSSYADIIKFENLDPSYTYFCIATIWVNNTTGSIKDLDTYIQGVRTDEFVLTMQHYWNVLTSHAVMKPSPSGVLKLRYNSNGTTPNRITFTIIRIS